ncbi:ABC transporter substrate-binding protein [Skermanella stibiiresistens SB22]|uniref:ABC transporter substrate-binding protein n=1 Tax=Skermanella stibiiresistens SB22 TaxID=1385369 RepID=W9GY86_9PROT|nr:TRAP transporter substrate-binding protein [Skermanella stibiiresistens]EWY36443.1 ABC transporter substrate-binding protein [Skermanella stibiiresistens SB22]
MKSGMKLFGTGLILSSLMFLGTAANAADIKSRTVKFAFQNTKEHPQGQGAQKFADLIAAKSDGKIKVRLFPGGTLGGDVQTISAIQGGTVEMSVMNAGLLSGLSKEFVVLDLPFLFNNEKEADAVLDGPIGKHLTDTLPEKGLIGLGYWDLGFRNVTNNRHAIAKADDIAGLKIRVVQSPIFIDLFKALGANPVPMPFPELYTALETGTVDGQENPTKTIELQKFYEVQKYMTVTRHVYNPQLLFVGKKLWDQLSDDEKKIFREAADEATAFQRGISHQENIDSIAALKGHKVQVTELAPEEIEKLRAKVQPVIDQYSAQVGEDLMKQMKAEIEKARN